MKPTESTRAAPGSLRPDDPAMDARRRAHDLRNALDLVVSATQLVRGGQAGPVTGEQARFLDHVIECAREARRLLDEDRVAAAAGRVAFRDAPAGDP